MERLHFIVIIFFPYSEIPVVPLRHESWYSVCPSLFLLKIINFFCLATTILLMRWLKISWIYYNMKRNLTIIEVTSNNKLADTIALLLNWGITFVGHQ